VNNSRKFSEVNFSEILHEISERKAYTQEDIAKALIIDRSYVSLLMNGRKQPSRRLAESILVMARESGVNLSQKVIDNFPALQQLPSVSSRKYVAQKSREMIQVQEQGPRKPYPKIPKQPTREDAEDLVGRYLDDAEGFGPGGMAAAYHTLRRACDPNQFDYDPADYPE